MAVNRVLSARLGGPGANETTVPLLPAEAIGVDAAVDAFTRGVAYVNHEEDVAGTLEPGKIADSRSSTRTSTPSRRPRSATPRSR